MTDDRIIDIFEAYGQYVTGQDYAMIRAIAEAVSSQRTWVGLDWNEMPEIYMNDKAFEHGAQWAETKLKEKNT